MLKVKRNTYPNVDLKEGDEVQWHYIRGCYWLYKVSELNLPTLCIKSYFASPNCNKDGIKSNGKQVDLVGVVGQLKSKGYILELE
jgi:hypothetical protein